jgi:hypothetical protein
VGHFALADRGYEVISCAVAGWRPNKTAIEDMAEKVEEAVKLITKDDLVIVHCFDNVGMSRSEEGVDLPIRKYGNKYDVEGDLVVTAKDLQTSRRLLRHFPVTFSCHPCTGVHVQLLL